MKISPKSRTSHPVKRSKKLLKESHPFSQKTNPLRVPPIPCRRRNRIGRSSTQPLCRSRLPLRRKSLHRTQPTSFRLRKRGQNHPWQRDLLGLLYSGVSNHIRRACSHYCAVWLMLHRPDRCHHRLCPCADRHCCRRLRGLAGRHHLWHHTAVFLCGSRGL